MSSARDREPLPLPAGEPLSPLPYLRIVLLRQRHDELVGMRRTRRLLNLLARRPWRSVGDVAGDALVEKNRFLRHDADLRAQRLEGDVADVESIHQDGAFLDVVKARDEVDERRLARAAQSHERDHFSGGNRERHIAKHVLRAAVFVVEADVPELDRAADWRKHDRVGTFLDFGVDVEQFEDALRRRDRLLQVGVHPAQFLDRSVHHERGDDEGDEVALRHPAAVDLPAAVGDEADDRHAAQKLHERRQDRYCARDLEVGAIEPLRGALEARRLVILGAKRLDDAMTGKRLDRDVRQVGQLLLHPAARAANSLSEANERINDNRRARDDDERELVVVVEHQAGVPEHGEPFAQQISDRFRHGDLDLLHVVRDARHQLPARPLAEECRRLP